MAGRRPAAVIGHHPKLPLADELHVFPDRNSKVSSELRNAIVAGYENLIDGRSIEFSGSLKDLMAEGKKRESEGWK